MLDRRRFLQGIAAAAMSMTSYSCARNQARGAVLPDPRQIIDLPRHFSYSIVSAQGQPMSDGLKVPGAHDGMAVFKGGKDRVVIVTNHELNPPWVSLSPYDDQYRGLPEVTRQRLYDRGNDKFPGLGGTTNTVYNTVTKQTEKQFLSLAGTELNCAGGATPWGSWLTCEECFKDPGADVSGNGREYYRNKRHGYVFEVSASATELVDAVPLKAMGRFEHEAAAVHAPSGIVYLTEDKQHSLFYRFLPNTPGKLQDGGRLQALAIVGQAAKKTHNWKSDDVRVNETLQCHWIDMDDVDGDENDLRHRGAAAGAAMFARGEGLTVAGDRFAFTCTYGGPARLGHVFTYKPSPDEGTPREKESPGELTLIAEASHSSLLKNCDNLTMAPWGDLIVCEDTDDASNCGLVGIRPDGTQYLLAYNAWSDSELAGVCFSPDGKIMFLNIQYPGMTLAITGPWSSLAA